MKEMLFALMVLIMFGVGFISGSVLNKKEKKQIQIQLEKIYWYYYLLNMWLEMKQNGKSVVMYLQKKGIKRIAIYGMKELGERFYGEVKDTEIEVVCIIDKTPELIVGDFLVISPKQEIPRVDAIIVTADYYYQEIERQLRLKVNCPIYSLNGILGNSFGRYL